MLSGCILRPPRLLSERRAANHSTPNASKTLPACPCAGPALPAGTKTMPPATVGPAEPSEPPLAGIPLTVWKSRAMSNVQRIVPSLVLSARRTPSQPAEKRTPGIVDTAASWPRIRPSGGSKFVNHGRSPLDRLRATIPPLKRPKYAFRSSALPPKFTCPCSVGFVVATRSSKRPRPYGPGRAPK